MRVVTFRCSSIGNLMTEPKAKAEVLSVGAKSYIRQLVKEDIFGFDAEFSSKETEKGLRVEQESIDMLNRIRGLSLSKNTERRELNGLTGECDIFDLSRKCGHDIKSSWSLMTFPAFAEDCEDKLYEWQMRGYMALWDAEEWEVNYCIVDTPDDLLRHEPMQLHMVSHIPEYMRMTTWKLKRDPEKEKLIFEKIKHATKYYMECVNEFDKSH
jgi:hypothetical protein